MDFSTQYNAVENTILRVVSTNANNQIISQGSGILIGDGTKAITCSHCILPNTRTWAIANNQAQGPEATIVYNNANLDIAILEFQNSLGNGITLGNSDEIKIGNEAFVAGYPSHSINITVLSANIAGFEHYGGHRLIKIDSSVNQGNSGGPLFNSEGELIGIINSKLGNLSNFLDSIENARPQARIQVAGIDPVQAIQDLIRQMKSNLNLGIGTVIPLKLIGENTNYVGDLLV